MAYNLPEEKDNAIAAAERALKNLQSASAQLQKAKKQYGVFWRNTGNFWMTVAKAENVKKNIREAQTNMYRFSRDDSDVRQLDTVFSDIIASLEQVIAPGIKYVRNAVSSGKTIQDHLDNALNRTDQAIWRVGVILEKLRKM